jgi:predicted regulator of Ras-like GTPase activity (Roadblock/LC7/MglB family)
VTFKEILSTLVDNTPGTLAAAIMASDGIPLEEHARPGSDFDLAALAVEFQQVFDQSSKVAGTFYEGQGDALSELILVTAEHQILYRSIDGEFALVIAIEPTGSLGKARYLARTVLQPLRDAL